MRELTDIPTDHLERELRRRKAALDRGVCPSCGQPLASHSCKFAGYEIAVFGAAAAAHIKPAQQSRLFTGGTGPYGEGA